MFFAARELHFLSEADYIVDVDEIEPRNVVNYRKNGYGDIFLDLLINSNCAMLNGRLGGTNDFTSVSLKGTAVVDYVFVSYDLLRYYRNMSVHIGRTSYLNWQILEVFVTQITTFQITHCYLGVLCLTNPLYLIIMIYNHMYELCMMSPKFLWNSCVMIRTHAQNRLINSCNSANINDSYDSFCYLIT